jgi:hypothetical protein
MTNTVLGTVPSNLSVRIDTVVAYTDTQHSNLADADAYTGCLEYE